MSHAIHISVRTLVEYVYSSGSIDSRFRPQSTLVEGTRIHQSIQKTYGEKDEREVYLSIDIPFDELVYKIDGRCDGLLFHDGKVTIDEIKSFTKPLETTEPNGYPVHWAQAKMYAYIYATQNQLSELEVQLTYVHVETDEKKYLTQTVSLSELEAFANQVIEAYAPFAKWQQQHRGQRDTSSKELGFPFPSYREGQRKLAGAVYKSLLDKKNLFAMAPTGIGKTISTLFPAVKAIGEGMLTRLFYLTARTTTRQTAEEAFARMRENGLCMKTVTITAKDKMCFKDETICQPDVCEFANGYYDRINGAVLDILENEQALTRDVIATYARKHRVCPFEYSLDLAYRADAIICDYNYIFDPKVSLKRMFEEDKKSTAILVDEAHNLVDRGREMFSASINKQLFLQIKKQYKGVNKPIFEVASQINSWFLVFKKSMDEKKEIVLEAMDDQLLIQLHHFAEEAEKLLTTSPMPDLLDAYFTINQFLKVMELLDEHYIIYGQQERNDVTLKLFCINPSKLLKQMAKNYRSKVFFSATLNPLEYYQDLIGGGEDDYRVSIPSPFSKEQVDVFIKPISTRYRDRERSQAAIVSMLNALIGSRTGNYLVFFPSYQYMLAVYEEFNQANSSTKTLIQSAGMTETERKTFLDGFQADSNEPLIGFAVLGGIFSEGVDLKGDRLNGVVVVGVGLPQIGFERNLIKEFFQHNGRNGYDYAYVFPGMNKVLQAGGRLIRSEQDYGAIVLCDDRFLQNKYQSLLPEEWKSYTVLYN
ncbi:helicase C-terminal domain-containing protein [Neobacillus dielmonensis]|uniref:helicase C-terminal domain-containing protein n=1 Tax=Neobacillus dielmonensis TaxID=1347369 RepID=UPI0005AB78E8|nr:helicase C-terminal domain-containing protein [Neobacillus dielmonensis]